MAAKKIKDTDYLYLSAYIHARESNIIGKDRIERMLEARSPEEALKVLEDAGWKIPDNCGAEQLEALLSARRDEAFGDMGSLAPNAALVDAFRIKYDYHNAKALVKAAAAEADAEKMLSGAGRVPAAVISECFLENKLGSLPKALGDGIAQAADVLARTGDPQLADFVLDKAYYAEFVAEAKASGSPFFEGYAALSVDCANLKSLVRAFRMKKDDDFIERTLIEGGSVKLIYILSALTNPESTLELFGNTPLAPAVEQAKSAAAGGRITSFEKNCDEVLNAYMSDAKLAPFGEKPLIGYLCAVEAEINSIRIVMTGQYAGIPAELTRQRLREGI